MLERQPRWDGLSSGPRFSVDQASSLALNATKARFPDIKEWLVLTIQIRNLVLGGDEARMFAYPNVWCYEITIRPKDQEAWKQLIKNHADEAYTHVILLDGTVVPARIKDKSER
jgi:hypothetical protein